MLKEKAALFTIGQFAALHEINKKTLMWYDEIGLLKPACIKENGYRYYSYQQSAALETILMSRRRSAKIRDNFRKTPIPAHRIRAARRSATFSYRSKPYAAR